MEAITATGGWCAPPDQLYDLAPKIVTISWEQVYDAAELLAGRWDGRNVAAVYGIPQGGAAPAVIVAGLLGVPMADQVTADTLVVDDLVDSGATLRPYLAGEFMHDALFRKPHSPTDLAPLAATVDGWLAFPWESTDDTAITDHVVRLLEFVGEDPTRDGLVDTPRRVVKTLAELTTGYRIDVAALLAVTFTESHDELIVLRGVPFWSLCEHHMLPFHGRATVGYVPRNGIVGLSKLARLVDAYARRLQVQERMTDQIADALVEHLAPLAVGVVVSATHTCAAMRGIQREATFVTSTLRGLLRERPDLRSEFMSLAHD